MNEGEGKEERDWNGEQWRGGGGWVGGWVKGCSGEAWRGGRGKRWGRSWGVL